MSRHMKSRRRALQSPPEALVYIGSNPNANEMIDVFSYNKGHFEETQVHADQFPSGPLPRGHVTWVNVDGVSDVNLIRRIGAQFGFHELVLEDIVHTGQRPKMEDHGSYIYCVLRMLYNKDHDDHIESEQVSLLLTQDAVFTFQEAQGDVFDPVRKRLREKNSHLAEHGADYLAYSLVDMIIDNYYLILEDIGDRIERLEEEVSGRPDPETLKNIHGVRSDLIHIRKAIWPLRELTSDLQRCDSPLIRRETSRFIGNLRDHMLQIMDAVETFRDTTGGLLDIYISQISFHMNEIMKTLTITATIFIPLTFVAGVYGMNFRHMPELDWRWGYAMSWAIMSGIALFMLLLFRRKKWI
ncbi:MAG TPA: magnesium/cobalt transporter CorA [Kiritimatiellia bacterium]|nr:magnesium/cobalt transporter CorA [Kiritimatiellia bacterium]HQQ05039.1 magnesium/cobalt transporter CorA [Kiritimatiellia bacterium]